MLMKQIWHCEIVILLGTTMAGVAVVELRRRITAIGSALRPMTMAMIHASMKSFCSTILG